MRRVLVTGASGFIGAPAVAALRERGFEVVTVGRREADLLDPAARAAVVRRAAASHLLHLAWYAEPGRYWTSPENARWVGATADLVSEFAAAGGRRAVLAGTCAEYDWTGGDEPLSEAGTPLAPATLYGVCKDATRRVTAALGAQLGVEVAWGRIFFLYGPREHPDRLAASVARALVAGEPARTSEGRQVRDFLHVDDVAGAFAALVDADGVSGAVNIGAGKGIAVRDLAVALARTAGREDLLELGALPTRPGEPASLVADVTRLRDEVGFHPGPTLDMDDLRTTLAWWRAAGAR